ncbi:Flavin-linked sulfhydryl oxidase of the mitochondrial IMS [Friedmanniomyces endolithicus]|nr:Flavin-linked sulfhydryl oxidase of the mitochondrial IMS [Friedmanniomyces endolithicus]KAK0825693.1 Flavin-linked sulfhydryl oxidase of the mitochondrial IMS [Friedmanniomyces endolithicus]
MPLTEIQYPILQVFLYVVESRTGMPAQPLNATPEQLARAGQKQDEDNKAKPLPKGVVLGPDGKPCRTCTSVSSWLAMAKSKPTAAVASPTPSVAACPPDVEELGRSSWTLLHAMTANYPEKPTGTQQSETKQFINLFGKMYPCWVCADDFRAWMKDGNEPRVSNRAEFGRWACEAHNAVNVKLGKESFDCNKWEERWRTGMEGC